MIVNLIKQNQMFSLTLPKKIKGQYWVTDIDENGKYRQLASVESINGIWHLIGNKNLQIVQSDKNSCALTDDSYLNLIVRDTNEKIILLTEKIDASRQLLKKYGVKSAGVFTIGRASNCSLCFENDYVSSCHAELAYDGERWSIKDMGSKNGTYINGKRVHSQTLKAGDYIYIMGLKIVIGSNFFAINNPDNCLHINSTSFVAYKTQQFELKNEEIELPEEKYFSRSPRFFREIDRKEIKIDPPPAMQKTETVPMALMLGPSITMGITSLSTGLITVMNAISNGGDVTQVLPTLIMSIGLLLGTILWPILTKKHEKKVRIEKEQERHNKYISYLNGLSDYIRTIAQIQSDILNENIVTNADCESRIIGEKTNLWERTLGQKDFLKLRLGTGDQEMAIDVRYPEKKFTLDDDDLQTAMLNLAESPKRLRNVPVSLTLTDNLAVGIYGNKSEVYDKLKSFIVQMVSLHSYDELKIMLIVDEEDEKQWDFVRYMPHFWDDNKKIRFFASSIHEVSELSVFMDKNILTRTDKEGKTYHSPYYVLISASEKLSKKCSAISRLLKYKNNVGFSVVFAGRQFNDFPKETKTIICVDGADSKVYDRDDTTGATINFISESFDERNLNKLAIRIANINLDLSSGKYSLPTSLTFLDMFNVGKIEHLNCLSRWRENNPTKTLQTPIGVSEDGDIFTLDLHEKFHGPHGLVAGMTGSGKSEFIITYILSLAINYHPDEVSFVLIDYKGGGLAGAFEDEEKGVRLPHLAGTITNLDGSSIKRSLISIQSELRRRQAIFNKARRLSNEGTMDIYKYQQLYRDKVVKEPLPHLFIISDEFAELKLQQPEFMEQLISAARIGRSLGVHLILATQKPSGIVDDQIWSNSRFRVCLKVQEKSDSQDVIKCADAAEISQTGRFYLQVGFNELFALGQSAWCGADYVPKDVVKKESDRSIQIVDNLGQVIMNVAPDLNKEVGSGVKQVVAIVKYLSDLAYEEKIVTKTLWLPSVPERIFIDNLEKKYEVDSYGTYLNPIVGEYDNPFEQKQGAVTLPISREGNCLVFGSTGSGKTTFITTLCYSLIRNHSADDVNLYLLDFGAGTLKSLSDAPQIGDVILSGDEEKTVNLFKYLADELKSRKALFSDFGGDFANYVANGNKAVNIVVVINNFASFAEQYEDLLDEFALLTREGVKYGIYFVVTADSINAMRFKIQQNFKIMMTMQLNDESDYSIIVGKTDGLIPQKCKGRGFVCLDRTYEFQTAFAEDTEDISGYLKSFCKKISDSADSFARPIPVVPKVLDYNSVSGFVSTTDKIPVGVSKETIELMYVNLKNTVIYPVCAQDISDVVPFAEEFSKVLGKVCETVIVDTEKLLEEYSGRRITDNFDKFVTEIFNDMVIRNNTYKDSGLDEHSLDEFEEKTVIIVGFERLNSLLSKDRKDKLSVLMEKAEVNYKIHFVICEAVSRLSGFNYSSWMKKHIQGNTGIWIGDGVADQFFIKISKITKELYEEIGNDYGYLISRNRAVRIKLLSSDKGEG